MNAKEFIIASIKDIVYLFNNVQCRYRYDDFCESHYIEIIPANVFKDSKELKNYRGQILDAFYERFKNESIVFLTEGSHIKMGQEEFKISGDKFLPFSSVSWRDFFKYQQTDIVEGIPTEVVTPEFTYATAA